MFKIISIVLCFIISGSVSSCYTDNSQTEIPLAKLDAPAVADKTPNAAAVDADYLCRNLPELKRMPMKDKVAGDLIYDGIMSRGEEMIPCLVERITDTTPMKDPREAPQVPEFKVGDAAFFMLHEITAEPLENALPQKVSEEMKTEGIYAYFNYVQKSKNRKIIQKLWRQKISGQ